MPTHAAALVPDADPSIAELIAARPHLEMHAMDGLVMEGVPLNAIADAVGTPTWVLSAGSMRSRLAALQAALRGLPAQVHYAVKANDHLAVLRLMRQGGAGADVVSLGELRRALLAGIDPAHIVFSGVGKTGAELRLALESGVGQINAESAEELELLSGLANAMGRTALVALRINPDVDAGTHAKITTGRAENKFGIAYDAAAALYAHAAGLPGIKPVGLAAAYRQPDSVHRALPRRLCPHGGAGADVARGRANGGDGGLRRRVGRSATGTSRHRCRPPWPAPSRRRSAGWTCALRWNRAAGWWRKPGCC